MPVQHNGFLAAAGDRGGSGEGFEPAGVSEASPVVADLGQHAAKLFLAADRAGRGRQGRAGAADRPVGCAACGQLRHISTRDRAGGPRCAQCRDRDGRDPISVTCDVVARLDPTVDRNLIASAVGRFASRPAHQRRIAWALEAQPELLAGAGHLAPVRAIIPLIDALHAGRCRDRPAGMPPLRSRRPDRQTSRRATRLPHLHRPHPHRRMRTLRRPPRTGHS
jgi:hypothetical protein